MKITKNIKEVAANLFNSTVKGDVLYVNTKGHFFTSKNLAELSEKKKSNIATITRNDVAELFENDSKTVQSNSNQGSQEVSIESLKSKGDELPKYLASLKQNELKEINDTLKIKYPAIVKNAVLVENIINALKQK